MTGSTLQQLAKGFWRILEVYLFFIVSVLGFTGLGKANFSFNGKKDRANGKHVERYLSAETARHLILPPCFLKRGFLTTLQYQGVPTKEPAQATSEEEHGSLAMPFFETLTLRIKHGIPKNYFTAYFHTSEFLHTCLPQLQAPLLI